jgi:hypothetical protein
VGYANSFCGSSAFNKPNDGLARASFADLRLVENRKPFLVDSRNHRRTI